MRLLVIVLCLLSERFLMHAVSYQRFSWFDGYCERMLQSTKIAKYATNRWLLLGTLVLPIILTCFIVYTAVHGIAFGFAGFLLSIFIFIYSLGPQNVFYPLSGPDADNSTHVGNYFADANSQLFAVLFWYIVAGPIAALTYRIVYLSCTISAVSAEATLVTNLLEWVPARITSILYLLVGNFQQGFSTFLKFSVAKPDSNRNLLSECGLQAVRSNELEKIPMPVAENLVEHAIIILLVVVALCTLVVWL